MVWTCWKSGGLRDRMFKQFSDLPRTVDEMGYAIWLTATGLESQLPNWLEVAVWTLTLHALPKKAATGGHHLQ
jgi:hypothetical protein